MRKNHRIDNIRALAILTVVFGHSIILYSSQWGLYEPNRTCVWLDYIKRFINLYQMPLFFSLSGYLFAMTWKNRKLSDFILNKIKRLIIPFFSIALLWMIPIKMIVQYPNYVHHSFFGAVLKLLNGTDLGHLWYLPTLFIIFIGMYLILKIAGNKRIVWIVVFFITTIVAILRQRIPCYGLIYLPYICQHAWGFAFGAVIYEMNIENIPDYLKYMSAIAAILFSVFCIYTERLDSLAASLLLVTSIYVNAPKKENNIMDIISEHSFGIYLIHSPLIYITFAYMLNANPIIVVTLNFVIFGTIAFVISHFIKKTPVKFIIGI